jgi:hypothetical protein
VTSDPNEHQPRRLKTINGTLSPLDSIGDHPGRVHGSKTLEGRVASDDMNESIEREFPGLRQKWFEKMQADIDARPEEPVDVDAFFEACAFGYRA